MLASSSDSSKQNLQAELAANEEQVRQLQIALADSKAERKNREAELAKINNELIVQRKIAEQTDKRNKKLTGELADANRQIDSQHAIALDLAAQQEELQAELVTANNRIASLESDLKTSLRPVAPPEKRVAIVTPAPPKPVPVPVAQKPKAPKPVKPEPKLKTAAPEAPTPPVEKTALPDVSAIDPFIHSWAKAWSRKDVEAYLAHYANTFKPSKGLSLAAWQKQRGQRLGKPKFIKIEVNDIKKKAINNSRVKVTFKQRYQSNTYGDRVLKTLELQWEKNGWKIVKETSKAL
jgi:hypothetical protein